MPPNMVMSKSEYLVPKLDGTFKYAALDDSKQEDLEKCWKSLDKFQKSHKGRLDSANNNKAAGRIAIGK